MTARTWIEQEREKALGRWAEGKAAFESFRDNFIALDDPTEEQKNLYLKMEHRYATLAGITRSLVHQLDLALRLPGGDEEIDHSF